MLKFEYLLLSLFICISGCTAAFEVGESLNQATTNIAKDPKILWSTVEEPASAPAATSEPVAAPAEQTK